MSDIWTDPRVLEALEERAADDIAVLACPRCGLRGYYNEGSHFTCLACDVTFYVVGELEKGFRHAPTVSLDDVVRLSDCVDEGSGS